MIRTLLLASFLVVSSSAALAQAPAVKHEPARPPAREAALWLEDANVLTAEMTNDQLTGEYAPYTYLLHGRLAQSWWKTDPNKAKQHLATATGAARERTTETPLQALRRLQVAMMIANIVIPLDPVAGDKMLDNILDQAAKVGPLAKSMDETNARDDLAREISDVGFDPNNTTQRRVKRFRAMIGIGAGTQAVLMLGTLYQVNALLADQFYGEMLDAIANHTFGADELSSLGYLSFPQSPRSPKDPTNISPQMTERMLSLARDQILQQQSAGLTRDSCNELMLLFRLIPHLPTDAQAEVTPVAAQCKSLVELKTQAKRLDELANNKPPMTADDYLQLAANATTAKERAGYKRMAITALTRTDPEKAMDLIDGLTAEEREFSPGIDFTREGIELPVVGAKYRAQDYNGLQNLLKRSPQPSKTALLIATTARDNPSYALSFLPVIVDKLADGKVDDSRFYESVLSYVAQYARPMLPVVFRDAVKGLNQVTEFIPGLMKFPADKKNTLIRVPFWAKMDPARLPPMFDVLDPRSTRLIIDSVKFPVARQSFRLWLLNNELKEYESARKSQPTPAAAP